VSIYPEELKMRNVVDRSTTVGGEDESKKGSWSISSDVNPASALNVIELNSRLAQVDWKKIARRKEMFNYVSLSLPSFFSYVYSRFSFFVWNGT
jgi:hypothetical protein